MAGVEEELERRSKFLNSLIQKKKAVENQQQEEALNVRVRASDMPLALQKRAFQCAKNHLDSMPNKLLDSKCLALDLKNVSFHLYKKKKKEEKEIPRSLFQVAISLKLEIVLCLCFLKLVLWIHGLWMDECFLPLLQQ